MPALQMAGVASGQGPQSVLQSTSRSSAYLGRSTRFIAETSQLQSQMSPTLNDAFVVLLTASLVVVGIDRRRAVADEAQNDEGEGAPYEWNAQHIFPSITSPH
jgi:hypothetical protein